MGQALAGDPPPSKGGMVPEAGPGRMLRRPSSAAPAPVEQRAQELVYVLRALESTLAASPKQPDAVGASYRDLSAWTACHQSDRDLDEVLNALEHEHMYPEWRRQALEDAYLLFYEDVSRADSQLSGRLPPPSARSSARGGAAARGTFETGSRFWRSDRWEYEIRETTPREVQPPMTPGGGRQIVPKGQRARYCACAADPLSTLIGSMTYRDCGDIKERRPSHARPMPGVPRVPPAEVPEPCLPPTPMGAASIASSVDRPCSPERTAPSVCSSGGMSARLPRQPRLRGEAPLPKRRTPSVADLFEAEQDVAAPAPAAAPPRPPPAWVPPLPSFPQPRAPMAPPQPQGVEALGEAGPAVPLRAGDVFAPSPKSADAPEATFGLPAPRLSESKDPFAGVKARVEAH